ncbi:helix-turn-helix domain-containing protein [Flavobacterium sp. CFBP9031]|uniref:helix-turn-helix domain-containing protein n=1 Tax=Flavobacterium sp. CFBP9031 TaxID=3096538 RepID=UPI002A6B326E|nr:helix-turn-helix domain-containing protein [Flavobacterium sp. CFBP9031]MDY0989276.1 helix-turn-helix domain-containing protein [Flavobacterium sp. CFBP9031]
MRLIISFFFLLLMLCSGAAQTNGELTEEKYLELQDKIRFSVNGDNDEGLGYVNQMLKSKDNIHKAFAYGAGSYLYQLKGDADKSEKMYAEAIKHLDKIPESNEKTKLQAYLCNYRGLTYWKRSNYGKALGSYQEGVKLSTKIGDVVQIVKFKANIALLNESVGNYQLSIKILKQNEAFLDKNESLYEKDQFQNSKSNTYTNLGNSYEGYYSKNREKTYLLDSAEYYYKKSVAYSDKFIDNKTTAKLSLGNIYVFKKDFTNAEKIYYDISFYAKQVDNESLYQVACFNLGDLYYSIKKYDRALIFLKKVDSISQKNKTVDISFFRSNYIQAKIYSIKNEPELAYKHSKLYLDSYEKYEGNLRDEALEVNYKLGTADLSGEMLSVQEKYKYEVFWNKALKIFYVILVVGIVFFLIKNIRDKNKAQKKMNALIEEFKANLERKELEKTETEQVAAEAIVTEIPEVEDVALKKENANLSIDEAKENKIVEKLLLLEEKLEYLNADFTLSYAAKKIKTNTTYLSYVVNKRFGKSFSEYSNELKINYVINQMITNHLYRKYSTQAIAESVGFKNAVSFAKSFRKRTGVSPAQFANNI